MALSTLPDETKTPADPNDSDEFFNNVYGGDVARGINEVEQFASGPTADKKSVQDQEAAPDNPNRGFKNNFTGKNNPKNSSSKGYLKFTKKFGPTGGIVGVIAGLGMLGLSFTPAMLLVNLKENLLQKFDLQNTSMTIRTNKIIAKKIAGTATSGSCSVVQVACRFTRPSNKLLKQLEKNGITPRAKDGSLIDKKGLFPNEIPKTYEFTDKNGKLNVVEAKDFSKTIASSDEFRSAFHKAYNPRFVGYADNIFKRVMTRFGINKSSEVSKSTEPTKVTEKINADTAGEPNSVSEGAKAGTTVADDAAKALIQEEIITEGKSLERKMGGKTDAFQLTAMATCFALDAPGIISKTARAYQLIQLVKYGFIFISLADAIKAGDATPQSVEATGKLLTDVFKDDKGKVVNGSAMDSFGVKYALFGDTKTSGFNKNANKFVPGGGVMSSLGNIARVTSSPQIKTVCNAAGSPQAAAALTAAELALAPETLGLSTILTKSIGVFITGAATMGAISKAVEFFAPQIVKVIPTDKILSLFMGDLTKDLQGEDVGNALASGSANMMGQTANAGGNAPLSVDQAIAYQHTTDQVNLAYAQEDRATLSPFDTSSPNTFLGSIATQLLPYYSKLSSASGALSSFGSIFSQSVNLISGKVYATTDANKKEAFSMCQDTSIANSGVAAGPFCDIQYGVPPQYLDEDPSTVIANLSDPNNRQIDPDTGNPIDGSDLANWLAECTTGSSVGLGACQITDQKTAEYSLYTIDHRIQVSMDEDVATTTTPDNTSVVSGDTKSLAKQIITSQNVQFQTAQEKVDFQEIVDTGSQVACGGTVPISSKVLSLILTASQKYKITIGVVAAGHDCNGGYHPKGQALDINGVALLDQPSLRMFDWTSAQIPIAKEFYQFLDTTAGKMGTKLELGQQQCFKGPPPSVTNSTFVNDTCNHIHVGVMSP